MNSKLILTCLLIFFCGEIELLGQQASIEAIDLINAFKQDKVKMMNPEHKPKSAGNCVSIGYIKAAIEVFGLNNVFQHDFENQVYHITLKDGAKVSFSQQELELSIEAAGFNRINQPSDASLGKKALYDSIYNYATIAFCVIAKRFQNLHQENNMTFIDALDEVNRGINVRCFPKYLGIQLYTSYEGWNGNDQSRKGEVGWFKNHVVYVSSGLVDFYGSQSKKKPRRYPKRIKIHFLPFDTEQSLN